MATATYSFVPNPATLMIIGSTTSSNSTYTTSLPTSQFGVLRYAMCVGNIAAYSNYVQINGATVWSLPQAGATFGFLTSQYVWPLPQGATITFYQQSIGVSNPIMATIEAYNA